MDKCGSVRKYKGNLHGRRVRVFGYTVSMTLPRLPVLVATFSLAFSSALHAQSENEVVEFDIPASTLPHALRTFARQSRIELVFAERGYDEVRTQPVVGSYEREQALQILLAGTGLRVGFGSGDSIIVQRADSVDATTGLASSRLDDVMLMAQAAVGSAQDSRRVSDTDEHGSRLSSAVSGVAQEPDVLEEVIATGTRIRGAQSASPIITIDRAAIDRAGFATVEEVVENLPQNFSAGASLDATNPTNKFQAVGGDTQDFAGGTAVNLRGLGASSTLILLNGRRMSASGFQSGFTSISSIPVSAIERVEVLTDGASAIYGSDAIAGVVNFILRESYDGAETRFRYGSDVRGGTSNTQFGQSFGTAWDSGNALLTYEFYDSEALAAEDREFTASNNLAPFGGTDRRQPGGNPANIIAGAQTFAIPTGQDGTALTPADFAGLEGTQRLFNGQANKDTIPALEQHSVFLHLSQSVGSVELFGMARFSSEERVARAGQDLIDFNVTGDDPATPGVIEGSPFFVDPTGTGLTSIRIDNYSLFDDFGARLDIGEVESSGGTLGAQFEISKDWHGEVVGNWSKEEASNFTGNQVDTAALSAMVNLTDPALAFNPFGDGSNTDPAILRSLANPKVFEAVSENEMWSVSFNVDGSLFDVGGGTAKLATGLDFREEALLSRTRDASPSDLSRDIFAAYGELFLPFVGSSNSRKGMRRLEVSLAARYEDYSDFGQSTNPKLGFVWAPTESLAFRGTIGTSYRAPSLTQLNASESRWRYTPSFLAGLPFSVLTISGRNSELEAEEATTWTAGLQWRAGDLSLDVTYFNVDFTGRIERPAFSPFIAAIDPRFASIRIDSPTGDQIAPVVNDPSYEADWLVPFGLGPFLPADLISGALPVGSIVDNRLGNLAQSVVTGAELQLSYLLDSGIGSFNFALNGSYMFDFERRLLDADPLVEEVDQLGRPVDFRARGTAGWSNKGWSVSSAVNYTDGYTDIASLPARAVDSWTTVDLTVAYNIGSDAGFLSDARFSFTTRNLFNEDPPFVDTLGGVAYDATNASPIGQLFSLQITKDW